MNCPSITPEQIELVQRTLAQLVPINDLAAALLQEGLLVLVPEIKTLSGLMPQRINKCSCGPCSAPCTIWGRAM